MRIGVSVLLAVALLVSAMPPGVAQAPIRGVVTNVRSTVTGPGTVEIQYDLAGPQAGLAFDVSIEASEDSGGSYPIKLSSVSGDAGPGIIPGTSKRAVWNAARDVERAAFDRFQYRITATAIPKPSLPAKAASGDAPAAAAPEKKGGGMKWVLIGGGIAGAGAAAALAGGSGSSGSTSSSSSGPAVASASVTGATDVLLAAANAVTLSVSGVSGAEGGAVSWNFGDGTTASGTITNGAASTVKTYSTSGSFVPRVTVSRTTGGSTSRDFQTITVATATGRWSGQWRLTSSTGTFTINLTQSGTQITGDAVDSFANGGSSRVSGSVSGPPSRMRLRLTYSDNSFYDMDVTGSSDQRTFSGTLAGQNSFPFSMIKQ